MQAHELTDAAATPLPTAVGPGSTDPESYVNPEDTPRIGIRNAPIPSVAAIAGHPIHPMLVPIPIGAFSFALLADLAYARTRDVFWARASRLLLLAGLGGGALAATMGATDFAGREAIRRRPEAWLHAGGNAGAMVLSLVNLLVRGRDGRRGIVPVGLGLSLVTGAALLVTGWLGGELSYRHRVGVTQD